MTVSVVFAIAGVIALLFGIIGGGIKAKEVEIPFLSVRARIITALVGLALIGATVWLENKNTLADEPVLTLQTLTPSPANNPSYTPATMDISTPVVEVTNTSTPNSADADLEKIYSKLYKARAWNLILQESFDNNDNKWTMWNVDDDQKTETMQIDNGSFLWGLKIKEPDRWYWEIAPLTSYSDIYYSVKVKRIGKPTEEQVNQAIWGIVFRRQGSNFYALLLNDLQEYSLSLHRSSGWTYLVGSTKSSLINMEKTNELAVIADGTEITFFINGTPIKTVNDSNLSEGNVGFYTGLNFTNDEVKFEFDDFEIRQKP